MPKILQFDKKDYLDKQDIRRQKRFQGGSVRGGAFWLPQKTQSGQGISDLFSKAFSTLSNNKDNIKNLSEITSNIITPVSQLSKAVTDTIKNSKEIKNLQLTNEQIEMALKKKIEKKGNGFYLI